MLTTSIVMEHLLTITQYCVQMCKGIRYMISMFNKLVSDVVKLYTITCLLVFSQKSLTSKYIVIAVGGRPLYPKNVNIV